MNSSDDSFEPVDKTGQSVLDLLQKAADATDQNTRQAVESAQMVAQQLKATSARIDSMSGSA
jgi:hypothetical protein